jgi:hypothetical protein
LSITYEWKIDFPLLLTILGVVSSFIYTNISNRKNKHINEWQLLAEIYDDIIFLLGFPLKDKEHKAKYQNENKIIEDIVRRKISDFELQVDQYWSYWHKDYPELAGMDKESKEKIKIIIDEEYENAMTDRQSILNMIISPAYYSDNENVYTKLINTQKHILRNSKFFPKRIMDLVHETINNDPIDVMMKYKAQLKYDETYFMHNEPTFADPYRMFLITLRRRHDWLILNNFEKIKELIRQISISKGKAIFSKDKWLYTGPILM